MRYVGIDQSYSGFAFVSIDADGTDVSGNLKSFDPKKNTGIERLLSIYQHLFNMFCETNDVAHICMEGYAPSSKFGREQAGELGAIVKLAIYDFFDRFGLARRPTSDPDRPPEDPGGDLRYPTIVQTTGLKKFVTGSGAAKKSGMMLAVYKKWGFETNDDNLADAFGLAQIALAVSTGNTNYAYEKAVLAALTPHTEMPRATIPST